MHSFTLFLCFTAQKGQNKSDIVLARFCLSRAYTGCFVLSVDISNLNSNKKKLHRLLYNKLCRNYSLFVIATYDILYFITHYFILVSTPAFENRCSVFVFVPTYLGFDFRSNAIENGFQRSKYAGDCCYHLPQTQNNNSLRWLLPSKPRPWSKPSNYLLRGFGVSPADP